MRQNGCPWECSRISFVSVRYCHCRRIAPTLFPRWGNNRAGEARPLALPLGELARLKAVTERVPGCNQRTNLQTCSCIRPLRLASLASSPIGGAKGGCAAEFPL